MNKERMTAEEVINVLAQKSADAQTSLEAMQYAQATLNVVQAYSVIVNNPENFFVPKRTN